MSSRIRRFSSPITTRKTPETLVPRRPPTSFSWPLSLTTLWTMVLAAKPRRTAIRKTTVECPSEKKKPTATGRFPSCSSLRVELSMAEMWSASKAWRSPKV